MVGEKSKPACYDCRFVRPEGQEICAKCIGYSEFEPRKEVDARTSILMGKKEVEKQYGR